MCNKSILGAVCACLTVVSFNANAQSYVFTDLGTLGGTFSQAKDLNNSGQIIGDATATTAYSSPALSTEWNGSVQNGFVASNSRFSSGGTIKAINNSGQIAGQFATTISGSIWGWRASVWDGSNRTELGTLNGTTHNEALDINDSGQVVGGSIIGATNGVHHATVWNDGVPTDLGADSRATAINELG